MATVHGRPTANAMMSAMSSCATFTTEIGSPSADALDLLSSWSATPLVDAATPGTS